MRKLSSGEVVAGFEIISQLGGGAEGLVYLARDPRLDRPVALKLLHDEALRSQPGEQLARLRHPNIVTVYAAGEHEATAYLVLEYVEGETLRQRLERHPMPARAAARCGGEIARALAAAHAVELTHGDLKPENVLLAAQGGLRVIDFAIARRGTPAYLSPQRRAGKEATAADDLWALGVLLCELLTGRRPPLGVCSTKATAYVLQAQDALAAGDGQELAALTGLLALANACLDAAAARRPAAEELAPRLEALARGEAEQELQPFIGLAAYQRRDAPFFFGRHDALARCRAQIERNGLLLLAGPSAAGKTSLLQAGLLPRLARHRPIAVLTLDGKEPYKALAQQLAALDPVSSDAPRDAATSLRTLLTESPSLFAPIIAQIATARGERLVLLLDHLERWPADSTRDALLKTLVEAAGADPKRLIVLLALRDEALPRLLSSLALRDRLSSLELLLAPSRAQLVELLTLPIERLGYRFEDQALIQQIVDEVGDEVGGLALLSFAAARLWQARDPETRLLTRDAYQAFGGLAGALKAHAEAALSALSKRETAHARAILVELTSADGLRRAVDIETLLDEVAAQEAAPRDSIAQTFEALVAARLIVTFDAAEEPRCELVHEELVRRWERLARWVDKARARATLRAELEQAAELWRQRGEQPDELWQGAALAEAQALLGARHASATITRFIQAAERQESRARRRSWLRQGALLLAVAALAALGASFWVRRAPTQPTPGTAQRHPRGWARETLASAWAAQERGARAEARGRLRRLIVRSQAEDSGARGLWWKLAARGPASRGSQQSASSLPATSRPLLTPRRQLQHPAGALRADDNRIYLWDAAGRLEQILHCPAGPVQAIAIDTSGERVAALSGTSALLWDRRSSHLREIFALPAAGRALAFTDAKVLVVETAQGQRRLSLAAHGNPLDRGHRTPVVALLGGEDGQLYSAGVRSLRRWGADGQQRGILPGLSQVRDLDGRGNDLLVLAERGQRLLLLRHSFAPANATRLPERLWLSKAPKPLRRARLDARGVLAIDDRGKLWRYARTKALPRALTTGHAGYVTALAVSLDGQRYATGGADGNICLHDGRGQALVTLPLGAPLRALAFAKTDMLAALDRRGWLHVIDAQRQTVLRRFIAPSSLERKTIARLAWAGPATVAVASGRQLWLRPLAPAGGDLVRRCAASITALASLPNAIAVGTRAGTVERWTREGQPLGPRHGPPSSDPRFVFEAQHVRFSGRRFAVGVGAVLATADTTSLWVGYADGSVRRFLRATGREFLGVAPNGSAVRAMLALPHGALFVGHASGELALWQAPRVLGGSDREPPRRLLGAKLHGTLHTLRRRETFVEATTSLGDQLQLDVELLLLPWQSFVTRVRRLPYSWQSDRREGRRGRLVWR